MATKSYALTTKERVKTRLGITVADFDDQLVGMIYSVTDLIEKYCGRRFKRTTYTNEIFNGLNGDNPTDFLKLPNAPIISVSAFEYNTGTISSPVWVAFDANSYFVDTRLGGIQMIGQLLPKGYRNLRVTYVGGYLIDFTNFLDDAQHTLPADISDLVERMVTKMHRKRSLEGESTSSFGESNVTWEALFTENDKAVVNPYRRNHPLMI